APGVARVRLGTRGRVACPPRVSRRTRATPPDEGQWNLPCKPQKASAETTSPPARVETPRQTCRLTASLTNAVWPSQNRTLTPPGWRLRAAFHAGLWGGLACQQSKFLEFGVR